MNEESSADLDFESVAGAPHGIGPNRLASRATQGCSGFQIKTGAMGSAYQGVTRHASARQRNPIMRTGIMQRIDLFAQPKNHDFSSSNDDRLTLAVGEIVQPAERNPHRRWWGQEIRE